MNLEISCYVIICRIIYTVRLFIGLEYSNSDNWASGQQRKNFEKKFGCKVRSYGTYGATWGDATDGVNSTSLRTLMDNGISFV